MVFQIKQNPHIDICRKSVRNTCKIIAHNYVCKNYI